MPKPNLLFLVRHITSAPKTEKIYIDRPLPDVRSGRKERLAWFIGALGVWGLSLAAIFNYEKQSSPVVNATLYSLRRNAAAREILGDDIQHTSRWPWIKGTINPQHGVINMSYKVKGDRGRGVMSFHSVRKSKSSDWELVEWKIVDSNGTTKLLATEN